MEISPEGIDAVIFDAGGVLLLPAPDGVRRVVAPYGAHPGDERCRWAHYVSTREVDRRWSADWRAVDRIVAAELGVHDQHLDDAARAIGIGYHEWPWLPVAGAAEALLALQDAGFALAVVSNAGGTMEELLAHHRICSVNGDVAEVAVVVDSTVVGVEKPDPAIFRFALDALGVPADRCLYVGDTVYFDVHGARAAGLHAVHLDPYDRCAIAGHPHVHDPRHLADRLLHPAGDAAGNGGPDRGAGR